MVRGETNRGGNNIPLGLNILYTPGIEPLYVLSSNRYTGGYKKVVSFDIYRLRKS
jgi:hypothetical protein